MAGRSAHRLLVVPQRRQALEKLVLHATGLRIPIVEVEGGTLTALTGFDGHQGVALVVAARRYADPEEILARATARSQPAFVLVLDSLEDPQNVGTLLRSAEAAGSHGVIFPTKRQAPLTPAAIKASAGAVEHLLLAPVDDLPASLADLHARGLRIVGADADATLTVREADLRGPLALVVGSEGQGLGPAVRRRCDLLVRIPMRGAVGSLNASVAGSILLYEAATQRGGATGAAGAADAADAAVHDALDAGLRGPAPAPGLGPDPVRAPEPELASSSAPAQPKTIDPAPDGPPQVVSSAPDIPAPVAVVDAAPAAPRRTRPKRTAGPPPLVVGTRSVEHEPAGELLPGGPDPDLLDDPSGPGSTASDEKTTEPAVSPGPEAGEPSPVATARSKATGKGTGKTTAKAEEKAAAKAAKRERKSDPSIASGHKGKAKTKGSAAERG